jgi:hypothetical protein
MAMAVTAKLRTNHRLDITALRVCCSCLSVAFSILPISFSLSVFIIMFMDYCLFCFDFIFYNLTAKLLPCHWNVDNIASLADALATFPATVLGAMFCLNLY